MERRTRLALGVALWVGPLLIGAVIALQIAPLNPAGPPPQRAAEAGAPDAPRVVDREPRPEPERRPEDRDRLQGTWEGLSLERNSRVVYRGAEARRAKVSFVGETVIFEEGRVRLSGTFRVDAAQTPKTFDLTITDANEATTYPAGIYELRGDLFRLCFAYPAKERPTEFATAPGSGRTLFVYRRLGSDVDEEEQDDEEGHLGFDAGGMDHSVFQLGGLAMNTPAKTRFGSGGWTAPLWLGMVALIPAASPTSAGPRSAEAAAKQVWDFESDEPGKIAKGFTNEVGQWEVAKHGDNKVLAQRAKNEDRVFNLALVEGMSYKDLDLSVRLRAVAGEVDRGGGLVWRAKDKNNYYIARYNPLEDNFRVYKVENGKRTQLDHADAKGDQEWHTLRITMNGREILGYLDGKKLLVAEDSTFPDAGKIGLWSKADAQSYFDDLTVAD